MGPGDPGLHGDLLGDLGTVVMWMVRFVTFVHKYL